MNTSNIASKAHANVLTFIVLLAVGTAYCEAHIIGLNAIYCTQFSISARSIQNVKNMYGNCVVRMIARF